MRHALIPGDQHLFVRAHDEKRTTPEKLMVEMEEFLKSNKVSNTCFELVSKEAKFSVSS